MDGEGHSFKLLKLSNPVFAFLELTYACEGRCPGCPALAAADRTTVKSAAQWAPIIQDLSSIMEEVRLTGGEPTLHPDFVDILESLKEAELPFRIFTNGLWPDSGKIFKALKKNRFFRGFHFSLHGSTALNHEFFTGLTSFNETIANIESAVRKGFPVFTSTVLGEFNRADIPTLMTLVARMGSRKHEFRRFIGPFRRGISIFREHIKPLIEEIDQIPPRIFSYSVGECFPRCFSSIALPCLAGMTHITLTPSGSIKACPFSNEILGTWEKGIIKGKRRLHAWTSDFFEGCLSCDEIGACMGGCRVMRKEFGFKRDPLMEEPLQSSLQPVSAPQEKPVVLNGRLKFAGAVRKEKFGFILIIKGEVMPVTEKGFKLITLCDGTREIGEIKALVGEKASNYIISLYMRGYLDIV